ncbi:MAG: electron transfer flavoprotein subunit alpha/FixB family protein [Planctomycetota bacterium]|nr:MAG: electron transfer flavoprotein subunit alpha/FixB family protein [Planctomycetota bacterium]
MREILIVVPGPGDEAAELTAAARSLGEVRVTAAVFGADEEAAADLAGLCERVVVFPAAPGGVFDGEWAAAALTPWIAAEQPFLVLLAHGNDALDLAPLLAARTDRPMLSDCLEIGLRDGRLVGVRPLHGGKVRARVAAVEAAGYLATVRPGAYPAAAAAAAAGQVVEGPAPTGFSPRREFVGAVAAEAGEVDITQAEVLVAVGRGIEEEENLDLIRSLAEALGAEVACTRPIVDKGWLEKSRQVGTSGRTVKPKVYLAIGVSGSFQHLGGLKGSPFLAAINQDPAAPIFAAADVGIVGDLFDLVPLLEEKIRERRG